MQMMLPAHTVLLLVSNLTKTPLFYLTSRGISKPVAIDMLTMAFLAEAVDEIDNDNLKDVILELLSGWLERRR